MRSFSATLNVVNLSTQQVWKSQALVLHCLIMLSFQALHLTQILSLTIMYLLSPHYHISTFEISAT